MFAQLLPKLPDAGGLLSTIHDKIAEANAAVSNLRMAIIYLCIVTTATLAFAAAAFFRGK